MNNIDVRNTEQHEAEKGTEVQNPAEKTFTQKEVDKIVEKRLERERKKYSGYLSEEKQNEINISEREKAVAIKEIRLEMKGILKEKNYPEEALELLDYTSKESCEQSLNALEEVINKAVNAIVVQKLKGGQTLKKPSECNTADIRGAFGLK